jgi:hypothetical protein
VDDWEIVSPDDPVDEFWFYRGWWDYREPGADLPAKNRRIVPVLHERALKPGARYVVWLGFPAADPVTVHVRVGLTPSTPVRD